MAMALLAFAGFLRFDELTNLKLEDLALRDTHFELFIESSKTDQYRGGSIAPIVKSGRDLCLWGNFETYLSQAKLTLPASSQGGDDYLFGNTQTKSRSGSAQAPNCLIQDVEKSYQRRLQTKGWILSLSLGTASEVAVHLPQLMVVSPIECVSAMVDGVRKTLRMATFADSLESRLPVSKSLGL